MNRQVIKNRVRKILAYTFTSVSFLLISSFLILQIPAVQEKLITRYLGSFSKATGFQATVKKFRLLWFDRLELEDLTVFDPANNRMIGAKKMLVNFKLSQLLEGRDVNIDGVYLDSAQVFITKINDGDTATNLNINVFIDRINEAYASSSTGGGRTPRINIGEAILNQSEFRYVDQYRDSIKYGFNYNQFTFDIDEGQLQNFMILGDTTEFNVKTLLATDRETKLDIKQLTTFFRLCQQSMEFVGLDMHAGKSVVSDTIIFTFNGQRELSDFVEKVNVHANLKNTILQPGDLALFAPEAGRMTQPIKLNGVFDGKINNFKFTHMEVSAGNTTLRGSLDMEGLPDINETFIILDLKNSRLDFNDLAFTINKDFISRLTPIGRVSLDGQFLGYPNDFVAKGNISSELGEITSDLNFKVNEKDVDRSVYSGALQLKNFDYGRYLNDTVNFQRVTLNGKVKGSGLTKQTADFKLNGKVNAIGIRGYDYTNIETNARFASELFNGFFRINDPNLEFTAKGSVDLRKGYDVIKVQATVDTAYLHNLHLTDKMVFIRSGLDVNTKGLNIDSLVGTADLKDFTIHYNDKKLSLPNIHLNAQRKEKQRSVIMQSTLVDAEAHGDFLLSDISNDVEKLVHEILLNVKNDKEAITEYYNERNYRPKSYETAFNIIIKNVDPLVDLLNVDLMLSDNTTIKGKFTSGYTTILQAYTSIDSLAYNKTLFVHTEAEITASKIADSTSVLAMAFINSDKQVLNKNLETKNLVTEAIWNKNHIDFGMDVDQTGQSNYVRLKGEVDFLKDSTQIHVLPTTINLLNKSWQVDANNKITLYDKSVGIKDLRIAYADQSVLFNGTVSEDSSKKLSITVNNLDLSILNPLTGREISGLLQASFDLTNYFHDPYVQNNISIDSLSIDHFLIGDVSGKNQWDREENKFLINFFVDRNNSRIVNLAGYYNPTRENNPLDITAKLEQANLKIIEPFFDDLFSQLEGTITGDYHISGRLQSPAIVGEGIVSDGQIMINYLKTLYQFTGIVGLSPNSIYFKDIELQDVLRNKAKLSGTITHQDFRSTRINVDAAFKNFQILNTTPKDNSLFYGQAYATGDLNILGPISNLKITANARTDKNTRISIPIGGTSEVEKKDFIKFVSFNDSTFQQNLKDKISSKLDLTGLQLDFNLDVTPDAYCEIIFDLQAGDKIRGRGNGEIQLQIDTKGEFNIFGPFEFTEGEYNFTLYDIINKEFEIKKGSRITWYGDAYTGNLDISATYNQSAAFGPIVLDPTISGSPQMRRKYPVQVLLKLDGPMLTPVINFDITATDLPASIMVDNKPVDLKFQFNAFKNRLDEQELKRQVFSLIMLRRFSPPESFNTGGSIVNSVSEFLSNQLSNWASQVDENLEIDVDLNKLDNKEFNTLQLRLSYTFLNGRLRVTRDGTFYSQNSNIAATNVNNQASTIAGDWTVDYFLTGDGKLKIKMYNRTNINPLTAVGSNNSVTTGVSLTHTQSFNQLSDLWKSLREKRKKKEEETEPNTNKEATKKEEDGGG
jgi:hypothetical protein